MIKRKLITAGLAAAAVAAAPLAASPAYATSAAYSGSAAGYALHGTSGVAFRYANEVVKDNTSLCGSAYAVLGRGTETPGVGTRQPGTNLPPDYAIAGVYGCGGSGIDGKKFYAYYQYANYGGTGSGGPVIFGSVPVASGDSVDVNVFADYDNNTTRVTATNERTHVSQTISFNNHGTTYDSAGVLGQFDPGTVTRKPTSSHQLTTLTQLGITQRNGQAEIGSTSRVTLTSHGSSSGAVWVMPTSISGGGTSLNTVG